METWTVWYQSYRFEVVLDNPQVGDMVTIEEIEVEAKIQSVFRRTKSVTTIKV